MSKKRRAIEKVKKDRERQVKRAAKERRYFSFDNWEEKKRRKRQSQTAKKEGKFPGISKQCWLETFQEPQPKYCDECGIECPYNSN